MSSTPVYFGSFLVTSQVFYRTAHSFALVNLKPLLPGHVLVCPNRVVSRIKDLRAEEVSDLFLTVQKVAKVVEHVFAGQALNIAIQDGLVAGQSVPHVHAHIIPRRFKDLTNSDDIYELIESDAGHLGKVFRERDKSVPAEVVSTEVNRELRTDGKKRGSTLAGDAGVSASASESEEGVAGGPAQRTIASVSERPKFPTPLPDELRRPRTVEEMEREARILAKLMNEVD